MTSAIADKAQLRSLLKELLVELLQDRDEEIWVYRLEYATF